MIEHGHPGESRDSGKGEGPAAIAIGRHPIPPPTAGRMQRCTTVHDSKTEKVRQ